MLSALALIVMTRLGPPLPLVTPADCRVSATETKLVVKSKGAVAERAFSEGEVPSSPGHQGPPRLAVLPVPGDGERLLVGLRDHWEGVAPEGVGHLYEVTCGKTPSVGVAMVARGLDFGRVAVLADGRWVVGGWGGLRVLDPVERRLTPLTSPPSYEAPRCWSAEEGKPAPAADVPVVGESGVAFVRGPELAFERGGPCGYEAEMLLTPFALAIDRGVVRQMRPVATFLRMDDGRMLVGDGVGPCEAQTPGAAWSSSDGVAWSAVPIRQGQGGVARLAWLPGKEGAGTWLAVTAICGTGGGTMGGDLYRSADLGQWELALGEPIPPARPAIDRGAGIAELLVKDGAAYARIDGDKSLWFRSADGRTWDKSPAPRVPDSAPARKKLATTLGVSAVHGITEAAGQAFAWTSDGLWSRSLVPPDAPWARIFPR